MKLLVSSLFHRSPRSDCFRIFKPSSMSEFYNKEIKPTSAIDSYNYIDNIENVFCLLK